eukprot:14255619-Ditylum_brightwellii.AAC.1
MAWSYIDCGVTGLDVYLVCCGSDVRVRQDVGRRELIFLVAAVIESMFCVSVRSCGVAAGRTVAGVWRSS